MKKVVIIGGVAGGATAAARLRRLNERAEIIIIERTGYVSYANCGLPYFVGGVITERSKLTLQTPESFKRRFNIDVRVRQEALSIDREAKTVTIKRLDDGSEYVESYDKLILSPGARAVVPDLPGVDSDRMFTLRTVEDTFAIYDFIEHEKPRRALIMGGGFIGLEMAENLVNRNIDVTVVQRSNHVLPVLDDDMASILHNRMRDGGINLALNTHINRFEERESEDGRRVILAHTDEGPVFEADMVILSIGVTPDSTLAKDAGLELGMKDSIKVDSHMRTSDPCIFAVGDAVELHHFVSGNHAVIALAGPANKQGRIAAGNVCGCGCDYEFTGSQGSSVMKMFDLTVASTGLSCKTADAAELDYDYVVLSSPSHATYYPGAGNMTLKVLFEVRSGQILGAQIVGSEGVDKRIDVIATAIRANMTAYDLAELDLAYAPPYSSAKDPVNMAGFAICNILEGLVDQVHWNEALRLTDPDRIAAMQAARSITDSEDDDDDSEETDYPPVLIDTRTPQEFECGHVDWARNFPLDELRDHLGDLPADRRLIVYCHSGLRSYIACRLLSQEGFDCVNVAGGYSFLMMSQRDKSMR